MSRLVVCGVLFVSFFVSAAPAKVKVFEADAHAEPRKESFVLHRYVENDALSVSEESDGFGWRRVRLPDGQVGFMTETDLAIEGQPAADAPTKPQAPIQNLRVEAVQNPAAGPVRSRIYIKDLYHLAELVKGDPSIGEMASSLATRETVARVTFWGGLGSAPVMCIIGAVLRSPVGCIVGVLSLGAAPLASYVIAPKQNEGLDVVNSWNWKHPDQQFALPGLASAER